MITTKNASFGLRIGGMLLAACVLLVAGAAQDGLAQTTGFKQTAAGPHDYTNTANWVGGTINGVWDASLTLGADQTVTFTNDTVLTTGLTFNHAGNKKLTLKASAAGTKTVTLGGDLRVNPAQWQQGVIIGDAANILNVNLGGVTRTVTVTLSHYLTMANVVTNGGVNKTGLGTLTFNCANGVVNAFSGGVTVAGPLALDFANLATPTDLLNSGNTLTLGGGALTLKGKSSGSTSQTLGNVTLNAGGSSILINPNGGTGTTLTLGTLSAAPANSSLLLGTAASAGSGSVAITTTTSTNSTTGIYGGRVLYTTDGGTAVDWATTSSGASPYTLSVYSGYTTLPTSGGGSTTNYKMTALTTLAGSFSVNTLKLEAPSDNLALGTNKLTIAGGGLLMTGTANARSITGNAGATRLTADAGSGYELIVHQYNTKGLTISAVIGDNGGNAVSLTKSGPGTLTIGGVNTYSGETSILGGMVTFSSGARLGSGRIYMGRSNGDTPTLYINSSNGGTITNEVVVNTSGYARNGTFYPAFGGGGSHITFTYNVVLNQTATIGSDDVGDVRFSGAISGSGGLNIVSAGVAAILANTTATSNSFSGGINLSLGKLTFGAADQIPNGLGYGDVYLGGGRLDLAGYNQTLNGLTGASAAIVTNSTGTAVLTVGANNGSYSFGGILKSGAGILALVKIGTGTQTLGSSTSTNSYSGGTTVSNGTLTFQYAYSMPSTGTVSVVGGAMTAPNGISATGSNSVLVTGPGMMEANTITVGSATSSNTVKVTQGGIWQLTSASPSITVNSPANGNAVIMDGGTLSYRGIQSGTLPDLTNNWGLAGLGACTWTTASGYNTYRLNNSYATNSLGRPYVFSASLGPTNYGRLELVGATNRLYGAGVTIDATGSILFSNTTATMSGAFTNQGTMTVAGSLITFATNCTFGEVSTIYWNTNGLSSTRVTVAGTLTLPGTMDFNVSGGTNGMVLISASAIAGSPNGWTVTPSAFWVNKVGTTLVLGAGRSKGTVITIY